MKDLSKRIQLRVTEEEYDFLNKIKEDRNYSSLSDLVRFIIGDYRRGLEMWEVMKNAYNSVGKGVENGDKQTVGNDQL